MTVSDISTLTEKSAEGVGRMAVILVPDSGQAVKHLEDDGVSKETDEWSLLEAYKRTEKGNLSTRPSCQLLTVFPHQTKAAQ